MSRPKRAPKPHKNTGPDGRVRARLHINGGTVYLGPWGSPEAEKEYNRLLAEWHEQKGHSSVPKKSSTVRELIVKFAHDAESIYVKPDGKLKPEVYHLRSVCKIVLALHSDLPASDFGAVELRAVRKKMVELDWCRNFIGEQIARVKRIWRWGATHGFDVRVALSEIRELEALPENLGRDTEPKEDVPDAVVEATLPFLLPVAASMVRLQRFTGMRPGEITKLRSRDLQKNADPEGVCWLFEPKNHKTAKHKKRRRIWIGPRAQAILAPLIEAAKSDDDHLFRPEGPNVNAQTKGFYRVDSYQHAVERAVLAATAKVVCESCLEKKPKWRKGVPTPKWDLCASCAAKVVPHWSPNQLRHSRLTEVAEEHGPLSAQATGGHSKVDMTSTYIHGMDEHARKAARSSG